MTGGRIKRLKPYLKNESFLTYGDGISDVNIKKLLRYHKKRLCDSTAVSRQLGLGQLN